MEKLRKQTYTERWYVMANKKMIMVIDTETANGIMVEETLDLSCSLVYDIGFNVIDKKGNIYERRSLAIGDILCGMKDLMQTAYYADKIPSYWDEIASGERELVSFLHAWEIIKETLKKWNINTVSAHNARFDVNSLNTTLRYLTKSKYRYFLPYGIEIWDTLKGANNTICKQKGYISFCKENGYMTKHRIPRVRATAEILYRYISGNDEFIEEHKGVNDTDIEAEILVQILRQHKKREFLQLYK